MEVVVSGLVERIADIRPQRILLQGRIGQPIVTEVEIVPNQKYPFRIQSVKARNGAYFTCELKQRCSETDGRCVIRIENIYANRGRYTDAIFLETDSGFQPQIQLYVRGDIQ